MNLRTELYSTFLFESLPKDWYLDCYVGYQVQFFELQR
jgi:hypothetical protein